MNHLDEPGREKRIQETINKKPALRMIYSRFYGGFKKGVDKCPAGGEILEIGSGAGFAKHHLPGLITSDITPYATVELCIDAMTMPFKSESLRAILMLNTLHHLPDVQLFFREAERCLRPQGRILITDHYLGWLSYFIYKFIHHEPFDPLAETWSFESSGPLSGANSALCHIIFHRDREIFEKMFPKLRIASIRPHTPFCYWLSGGLKKWSALPESFFPAASAIDEILGTAVPQICSFADIELVRA